MLYNTGPVAGGYLSEAKGWRWVFWVLAIVSGALTVSMFMFMKESYAPLILQRKADRLRKETGNMQLHTEPSSSVEGADHLKRGLMRPSKIFFKSPLVITFAFYMAIVYGDLYLLFTTITEVFEQTYDFSTGTVGLVYLGIGVGMILGLVIYAVLSDRTVKRELAAKKARGDDEPAKPELRLLPLPVGGVLLPAGFFIYGWVCMVSSTIRRYPK